MLCIGCRLYEYVCCLLIRGVVGVLVLFGCWVFGALLEFCVAVCAGGFVLLVCFGVCL